MCSEVNRSGDLITEQADWFASLDKLAGVSVQDTDPQFSRALKNLSTPGGFHLVPIFVFSEQN